MLLKKVRYNNFRPFIGQQEIDLSPLPGNEEATVTVLLGENTFGKSTFVLSFIWCLYGESRFDRPTEILNKKIERQMHFGDQETAWVEIAFEDDNTNYIVKRTQRFTMGQNGRLSAGVAKATLTYVTPSGETKMLGQYEHEVNEAISAILPKELSSFFFFEGEKDNAIAKKDVAKSVRTLLGLEAFENMRDHLHGSINASHPASSSVMGMYLERQNDESDVQARQAYENAESAKTKLEEVKNRIIEINNQIDDYERAIEGINETLRQAAPSKELQKRRDEIRKEYAAQEVALDRNNKRLLALFSRDCMNLFVAPFMDKTRKRLSEMDVADKGIRGIEDKAIYALLERGTCLCGTELKPGTVAYRNVEQYIEFIPPRNVGTLVREMIELIDSNEAKSRAFVEDFEAIYCDIKSIKATLVRLEKEEKEKLAEISRIGNVNTSSAEENLAKYKQMISDLRSELLRRNAEEARLSSEIERETNRFNMYKSKSEKAREYNRYYRYAEAIYNWLNVNYTQKEENMRRRLSDYIADLFNNMYHGERTLIIDKQYNITAQSREGNTALTGGLRVIAYFAFVGGLVKLAYEVMQEREKDEENNEQALGEHYPLVLDAAFSHADETHTKNIAKELATAVRQLVFAVMPKDWAYAKEGLDGKVGRIYELKKIDESEARIVEVN